MGIIIFFKLFKNVSSKKKKVSSSFLGDSSLLHPHASILPQSFTHGNNQALYVSCHMFLHGYIIL